MLLQYIFCVHKLSINVSSYNDLYIYTYTYKSP